MVHWLGLALTDGGFVQMLCHVSSLSPIICDYVEFFPEGSGEDFYRLRPIACISGSSSVLTFKSLKTEEDAT